jgi:hypothetical protein
MNRWKTTQIYLEATLTMKEQALATVTPLSLLAHGLLLVNGYFATLTM